MIYLTQYVNRKNEVQSKKFNASSSTQIRDRIRREGARDITILPEGRGYFCKKCRLLIEGYSDNCICEECSKQE